MPYHRTIIGNVVNTKLQQFPERKDDGTGKKVETGKMVSFYKVGVLLEGGGYLEISMSERLFTEFRISELEIESNGEFSVPDAVKFVLEPSMNNAGTTRWKVESVDREPVIM